MHEQKKAGINIKIIPGGIDDFKNEIESQIVVRFA